MLKRVGKKSSVVLQNGFNAAVSEKHSSDQLGAFIIRPLEENRANEFVLVFGDMHWRKSYASKVVSVPVSIPLATRELNDLKFTCIV